MAEYAQFYEFRRHMNQVDLGGVCDILTFHKNKDQLSRWLQSQVCKEVASDAAGMHGIGFCSFEQASRCPFGYLSDEIKKSIGAGIARVITQLVAQKESTPSSYGDGFKHQYDNVYGVHSYDTNAIVVGDDEILVAVNSNAPDDFIESFNHSFVVTHKQNFVFLTLVPKGCFAIGVAILSKSNKMIQIHVGVALKNATNVRIITNEQKSSQFDKMMTVNTIIDKAGFNE